MTPFEPDHHDKLAASMELALDGILQATARFKEQRNTYVSNLISLTENVAVIDSFNKAMPFPAHQQDRLDDLKRALETLEDLIFNPQDRAEILTAIRTRTAADASVFAETTQRVNAIASMAEDLPARIGLYRRTLRRRAVAFCAAVTIAAAVTVWFMA